MLNIPLDMDDLFITSKSRRRPVDDDTVSDSGILNDEHCKYSVY